MSDEQNAYPQWSGSDVEPTYAQAVQFATGQGMISSHGRKG